MTIRTRKLGYALVLAAMLVGACKGGGEQAEAPVDVDTTNKDWADGLSAQQIEAQARAMTPEQAAAAGVAVDSSIHMENLGNSDSIMVDNSSADSTLVAPTRPDTAPTAQRPGGQPATPLPPRRP